LAADFTNLLTDTGIAYQSARSSASALWQNADAMTQQRLDALLNLEAGAMGLSKDAMMRDLLFALSSSDEV
jgi:hypothetical protein